MYYQYKLAQYKGSKGHGATSDGTWVFSQDLDFLTIFNRTEQYFGCILGGCTHS